MGIAGGRAAMFAVFLSIASVGDAQDTEAPVQKTIPAVFTSEPPTIDGKLDDPVWERAAVINDLHVVIPDEYAVPSEESVIRVLYGPDALYFSAQFYDSEPQRITALVMRQGDASLGDDAFSVILDPLNQGRSGYIFDINPNGVRNQGLYNNVTDLNWQWQAIWRGAARIDDRGWTAEVAIPFKTLSFDPDNDTWGLNFTRWLGRQNARFGWVSNNREQNPANSGRLVGVTDIEQGLGLDLVPGVRVGRVDDDLNGRDENFLEPSLDAFYKVTPALTAALTLNTDFSGTTADARQVNLTRFDLFFPEQRKFFLQDADIFEFGRIGNESGRPFFSRRIGLTRSGDSVDLDAGGKLTGRAGPFDIGILAVRQDSEDRRDKVDLMVARLAANVLEESSIGVIATSGNPAGTPGNQVVGADFRYLNTAVGPDRNIVGSAWYQYSDTDDLPGDSAAFGFSFAMPARRGWLLESEWKEVQENYFPGLGFVSRTGIRESRIETGYNWRPTEHWLRSVTTGTELWHVQKLNGQTESQVITLNAIQLENQTADQVSLDVLRSREVLTEPFEISPGVVIPVGDYTFDSTCTKGSTGQFRTLSARFSACRGQFYGGHRTSFETDMTWRPNPHFRFGAGFEWNDVNLPQGSFITRLASLRADLAFTETLYWENFFQYDNVSQTIGVNSIVRWVPEAGKEAVLVLNHQFEDFDRDDRFASIYNELTFKLGYTFRF